MLTTESTECEQTALKAGRSLRHELADANANHEAAEAAVRQAKTIADKAARHLSEAADAVKRLKSNLDAARCTATVHRAEVIAKALQAGIEPRSIRLP